LYNRPLLLLLLLVLSGVGYAVKLKEGAPHIRQVTDNRLLLLLLAAAADVPGCCAELLLLLLLLRLTSTASCPGRHGRTCSCSSADRD
jgi:hypothetical protein